MSFKLFIFMTISCAFILSAHAQEGSNAQNKALITWTHNAAMDIMNFDFENVTEKNKENSRYFTKEGYKKFIEAFEKNGFEKVVIAGKQRVTSSVKCVPEIVFQKKNSWTLTFPMEVQRVNHDKSTIDYLNIIVVVKEEISKEGEIIFAIKLWVAYLIESAQAKICSAQDRAEADIYEPGRLMYKELKDAQD